MIKMKIIDARRMNVTIWRKVICLVEMFSSICADNRLVGN